MATDSSLPVDQLLSRFEVDEDLGFLAAVTPTLPSHVAAFVAWETFLQNVPKLVKANFYQQFAELPDFPLQQLQKKEDWQRAMVLLSMVANTYIWAEKSNPKQLLPRKLAVPFVAVAHRFELPPIICQASLVLWNWTLTDPSKPLSLDNLTKTSGFLDDYSEDWFYLVTTAIEHRGAATLRPLLETILSISKGSVDDSLLLVRMQATEKVVRECHAILLRMNEKNDPHTFYHTLRPYLSGSLHNPALPHVVYEGCFGDQPKNFAGGSAAQSSLIQAWDAVFSVEHKSSTTQYLRDMRNYMPGSHRRFLEFLESSKPSIKDYIQQKKAQAGANDKTAEELARQFDACLTALSSFRSGHMQIVARYIIAQASPTSTEQANGHKTEAEPKGTGGTTLIPFLKLARKDTDDAKLMQDNAPNGTHHKGASPDPLRPT